MSRKRQGRREERPAAPVVSAAPAPADPWVGRAAAGARLLIGLVLLVSGLEKSALPPEEFAAVIQGYFILPPGTELTAAMLLPGLEVLVGLSLLAGYLSRAACAAAGALLLVFIAALGSTVARGIPLPDCGCFGRTLHLSVPQALGLDSALLCLSYFAYRRGADLSLLDDWVSRGS